MELYDVLSAFCSRRSGVVDDTDKRKYAYMIRRLFSAQYPLLCDSLNSLESDPLYTSNILAIVASRYNGLPNFLRMKITQKKKKETIREKYDDCVIDKYMEVNECGIREVEEAYEFNKDEVEQALNLIKMNYFDNKSKVIVKKGSPKKSKPVKKEEVLF
jgi:hypothetical protein